MLADVLPPLPSETVALAGNDFLNRLKLRGLPSLFTRLLPESAQPPAASHDGRDTVSLAPTYTSASAVTLNVASVAPVKALESLAVRIQSAPATREGTDVKV